jgi:hypothetical protein
MIPCKLRPCLGGAILALATASAAFAAPAPAPAAGKVPESIMGFTRAQVGDIAQCGGEASFAMAAYVQYQGNKSRDEARAASIKLGTRPQEKILSEIDRVYAAKPKLARDWAERTFATCLAGKKVPLPAGRASVCYDATLWVALLVGLRIDQPRAAVVDSIVADRNSPLRTLVGAEYDAQKSGDELKANMHSVGEFLRCAAAQREAAAQPARARPAAGGH